ncbi:MAG TPA: MFS transporter [Gemmatimonadaceae bacterium]|nr:MFS transporter [Gemmatimonadaceae bacterium]
MDRGSEPSRGTVVASSRSEAARAGASAAFAFVVTMGIVNLFGDTTYEGGASINGQFLGTLGASAAAISIVAGAGEFLGYSLRSVAGWTADRTGKYWPVTFVGFAINLFAVPAMALAGSWQVAGLLILAERTGRAIRKPTVEAMLSYSTGQLGTGWVYALNTALDETGATIGPLLMAFAIYRHASYRAGYSLLLISASLAFVGLVVARVLFPVPSKLAQGERTARAARFTPAFWLYMVAAGCFGAGLMSFEFISFHLASHGTVGVQWIPIFLGISTGFGVLANLVLGRLYDRAGIGIVVGAVFVSALFSPLVFLGGFGVALVGMLLWGVGYAVQDTLFKAVVADRLPEGRRNFAFGIFYTGYGGGWLVGSIATGLLYQFSVAAVIAFSMAVQLGSIPLFLFARHRESAV